MSFPKTLAKHLAELGLAQTGPLVFEVPAPQGHLSWQHSFERLDLKRINRGLSPDESARTVAKDIPAHVLPFLSMIRSDEQFLPFLFKGEEPLPWFRSQGLSRLAEFAKTEAMLDVPTSALEHLASAHRQLLDDQVDRVSIATYTERIRSAASSDAQSTGQS